MVPHSWNRFRQTVHASVARLTLSTRPKSKGKKPSSSRWLKRQQTDVYVKQARSEHYRSRSAFKLIELNDKYNFLKPGSIVVDCGARPGSWSQVAAERTGSNKLVDSDLLTMRFGAIIAVDIEHMDPLPGVIVQSMCDFTSTQTQEGIRSLLRGSHANVIMSDMAPNASGLPQLDHERILELCYSALAFSQGVLKKGGVMMCKLWEGASTKDFKKDVEKVFGKVAEHRPKATRKESRELFIYASGYKGCLK